MQDKLRHFKHQFIEETKERIQTVNTLALTLESEGFSPEVSEAIKREMHTIKGGSRILGLKSVSRLSHSFEDIFSRATTGRVPLVPGMIDRLLKALDLILSIVAKDDSAEIAATVDAFILGNEETKLPLSTESSAQAPVSKQSLTERLQLKLQQRQPFSQRFETRESAHDPKHRPFVPLKMKPAAPTPSISPPSHRTPEHRSPTESTVSTPSSLSPLRRAVHPDECHPESTLSFVPTRTGGSQITGGNVTAPTIRPPVPPREGEKEEPPEETEKFAFSNSFRVDGDLIDKLAEGALQLKVMGSFLDLLLGAHDDLGDHMNLLQRDLGSEIRKLSADPKTMKTLENIWLQLRDLGRHADEKRKWMHGRLANYHNRFEEFYRDLENLKLIPLTSIFAIYPRFIRDYAVRNGKSIRFEATGGATRLDKQVTEAIHECLIHLLRNAVDHAIETSAERQTAGKDPMGRISLSAVPRGDHVLIQIRDDGCGFDLPRIREAALRKGVIEADALAQMSEADIINLVFQPGFTTAPMITDTSGRGVGMDVVASVIRRINGSVTIQTEKGVGSTISLRLPIRVSTSRVLHVRDGQCRCTIPTDAIRSVHQVDLTTQTYYGGLYYIALKGQTLPVVGLATLMGFPSSPGEEHKRKATILLIGRKRGVYGLIVDETLSEENIILHRKDPFVKGINYVAGFSVSLLGEPFWVLDPSGAQNYFKDPARNLSAPLPAETIPAGPRHILLVDDSTVTRDMERAILESAGYQVIEASNGLEGLEKFSLFPIECVVTDVEMPQMDGFVFTERIRSLPSGREMPIVVVTTRESREDKIRGIQAGANAYITKLDFDKTKLLETIQRLIG